MSASLNNYTKIDVSTTGKLTIIGTGGLTIPSGTTLNRPPVENGLIRYNEDINDLEIGINGSYIAFSSGAGSYVNKAGDSMSGPLLLASGTITNPSLSFSTSTGTGITLTNPNELSLITNGLQQLKIDAAGNVDITSDSSFKLPVGTTAQRPISPLLGMERINSTLNSLEIYTTAWNTIPITPYPITPNTTLQWDGSNYSWATVAGGAIVVPDITARNALPNVVGQLAFVEDKGDGEFGFYIQKDSVPTWTILTQYDSSLDQSTTQTFSLNVTTPSPYALVVVPANSKISSIILEVTEIFDDLTSTLVIGDSIINDRLMDNNYHDLSTLGQYTSTSDYVYLANTLVSVYFNFGTSTQGTLNIYFTTVKA